MFKVHVGYTKTGSDRWKRYATLAEASAACEAVRKKTGIILTIIKA